MERMCENVADSEYNRIQHFISVSPWNAAAVMHKVAYDTSEAFRNIGKVGLLIDESGFEKKGTESVGVSRQYNGNLGKVDNCQVAVFAALSGGEYYSLVDTRLYLPKEWTDDKKRCLEAGVPEEQIKFRTKPELALEMIKSLRERNIRFDWVDGDGLYGNDRQLTNALDEMREIFVLEIHSNQHIYLEKPEIFVPVPKSGKGRKPSLYKCRQQAVEVRHYAAETKSYAWRELSIRDTTKGILKCEALVRKIWIWDGESAQAKERLLLIRKTLHKNGFEIKYALTNAQENQFSWIELIRMQSQRYFIERAFQESKQELGAAEYQIRGWRAWHHHVALVMMALNFVLREKMYCKEVTPLLSTRDVRELLTKMLATKKKSIDDVLTQMKLRHKKRKSAIDNFHKINLQI